MEINITKDWDNPLLDRKEITFNISHSGETPSRDEIKNKLVAQLNSRHELVIVDKIRTEYGTQNTYGYAKIYSDVDRANEIENKYVLKRNEQKPVEEMEKPSGEESGESSGESTEEEAVIEEPAAEEETGESSGESTEEEALIEEPAAEEETGESSGESTEEEAVTEEPAAEEEIVKSSEESTEEEAAADEPVAEEEEPAE